VLIDSSCWPGTMAIGWAIGASERNRELAHVKIRQRRRGSMRHGIGMRNASCQRLTASDQPDLNVLCCVAFLPHVGC